MSLIAALCTSIIEFPTKYERLQAKNRSEFLNRVYEKMKFAQKCGG